MILDRFSLHGKVAVVTGAGRGLGRGIALGLAEAGCDLVLLARTAAEIEAVAAEARALGRRALALPTDVRDAAQVEAAAQRAVAELGRIDVLMNNAGGGYPGPLLDLSDAQFDEVVRWNLRPVFLCCRAFGRLLRAQRAGSIINMSSIAGRLPTPGLSAYAATKAAVISLTASLARELAPFGVRVNAVAPGKMIGSHTSTGALWATAAQRAEAARDVALGRLGEAEDVAPAVVFLASDAAAYVTGQTLDIDGGWGALSLVPEAPRAAGPSRPAEDAPAAGEGPGGDAQPGPGTAHAGDAAVAAAMTPEVAPIRVQIHLSGDGGGSWYVEARGGRGVRREGTAEQADATLRMAAADWQAIRDGRLDRMMAFLDGKMQLEGDVSLLAQLEAEIDRLSVG